MGRVAFKGKSYTVGLPGTLNEPGRYLIFESLYGKMMMNKNLYVILLNKQKKKISKLGCSPNHGWPNSLVFLFPGAVGR